MIYGYTNEEIMQEYVNKSTELVYKTSTKAEESEYITEETFQRIDKELFKALLDIEFMVESGDYDIDDIENQYHDIMDLCDNVNDYINSLIA